LFRYHQVSTSGTVIGAALCAAGSLQLYFGEFFLPTRTSRAIGAGLFVVGASAIARGVGLADQYGVWSVKRMRALYKRKGRAS
jgi:hypothetical protein